MTPWMPDADGNDLRTAGGTHSATVFVLVFWLGPMIVSYLGNLLASQARFNVPDEKMKGQVNTGLF